MVTCWEWMLLVLGVLLIALVIQSPSGALATPRRQFMVDIKSVALTKAELPRGFDVIPDRTVSEERPDGVAVYDGTYARERSPEHLAAGPSEIRSGVARTAPADDARALGHRTF